MQLAAAAEEAKSRQGRGGSGNRLAGGALSGKQPSGSGRQLLSAMSGECDWLLASPDIPNEQRCPACMWRR